MKAWGAKNRPGQRRFLFLADNLALDLVNTEVIEAGQRANWLVASEDLAAWLTQAGLAAGDRVGPRLLHRTQALRSSLRRMAEALAGGRPVPAAVVPSINRELREARTFRELARSGRGYEVRTRSDGQSSALLAPIAQAAAELLARGDRLRVRRCGNPACILYFYDTTRSHTRRWCSMAGCGNRMKVAAHYRRRKAR